MMAPTPVATEPHAKAWVVAPARAGAGATPECVKVMHVIYALQPGGMEFGVVKVVNGLDSSRIRSSICSTAPAVPAMKALVLPGVPVFELRRRKGNDPRLVLDLFRLFRRERPHVVHTHGWGTLLEGLVAARLARVPAVVHGEHGTLQLGRGRTRVQRWAWGRVTQVLSVSRRLAQNMSAATGFTAEKILTIQNGVDSSRFSPAYRRDARAALGISPDQLAIGTAGRLVPVKDHANLLEAFALLKARGVQFVGVIAGEGPLRDALEAQMRELQLTQRVRLLGQRADVERVFSALDIFVLPSRSEGMSNTILEAMASAVPVVATHVGGADELVDHGRTGLLVPPGQPTALAAALEDLALHPERRRSMAAAAHEKAQGEFSLGRMVKNYEDLYLNLMRKVPRRRR